MCGLYRKIIGLILAAISIGSGVVRDGDNCDDVIFGTSTLVIDMVAIKFTVSTGGRVTFSFGVVSLKLRMNESLQVKE